ncbi:hypothetical protein L6164_012203 [Bauhinia variegata]|uniref:Uncharacterized protein n=1 Tax=Bauhinia variegata TaxID=167791 RepID=A0ACB9PEH4_BAUVA|nr:hypothetical protein L6164_012203 [Bauhinia variegata]
MASIPSDYASNPFFLHPSNSTGLTLVSQPLTSNNHSCWRRALQMALLAKNKLGFVDGLMEPPDHSDMQKYLSWQRSNNVVWFWLLNSISKEITASVVYSSTVVEIWKDLEERFQ